MELTGELLEKLAEAAHEVFCQELKDLGYEPGEVTDEKARIHSSLKPYAELPEEEQEQNRDTVRDITNKLVSSGYVMIQAKSNEPAFEFPGSQLEKMAETEHERWMRMKLDAGWQYAPLTNKALKQHANLLPWDKLPEVQKEKDQVMIRAIPKILRQAGYTIVRLKGVLPKK